MATGQCSSRTGVVVVAWQQQSLIPTLLRKDVSSLKSLISSTGKGSLQLSKYGVISCTNVFFADELMSLLLEHTSGGCNVLHVLALLARPPTPSRSSSPFPSSSSSSDRRRGMAARTTPRSGVLREIMKQAMALASGSSHSHGEL